MENLFKIIFSKKEDKKEVSTLVSKEELIKRASAEGVDTSKICSCVPRWAESAPLKLGVKSALVRCDLILRSDGSIVALDGMMGIDSIFLYQSHLRGESNPKNFSWEKFIRKVSSFSKEK